jgi:beta-phosphoglucomutase family hydrolase
MMLGDMADRSEPLGLPEHIEAGLFDMDGVLTDTAKIHAAAWKQMFDEFLEERGGNLPPFDIDSDYGDYVDGKPRYDGVRSFLVSRGIELSDEEVHALGDRKNELVQHLIHERGVDPYPGSVRYVNAMRDAGLRTAVVSSSANTHDVLEVAGLSDLFGTVIDGHAVEDRHLKGKPAPDTFLEAAKELGVKPAHAAVFEDALAGVEAGRAGDFGAVVGVDRVGHADALRAHGADIVVQDLGELLS